MSYATKNHFNTPFPHFSGINLWFVLLSLRHQKKNGLSKKKKTLKQKKKPLNIFLCRWLEKMVSDSFSVTETRCTMAIQSCKLFPNLCCRNNIKRNFCNSLKIIAIKIEIITIYYFFPASAIILGWLWGCIKNNKAQ